MKKAYNNRYIDENDERMNEVYMWRCLAMHFVKDIR